MERKTAYVKGLLGLTSVKFSSLVDRSSCGNCLCCCHCKYQNASVALCCQWNHRLT
uniref:Uncharacterized protein n=1 Tax=Anguilla anguilla TaxID=7936 RepID=A0A0E9SME4_ANGAN